MTPVDPEVLTPLLRTHLHPAARCTQVRRGTIGNGQETWFVSAHDGRAQRELVLRRSSPGGTLHFTDREREYEVLRALAGRGLPVPAVHWLETEPSTLGRPYFVMERLEGGTRVDPADAATLSRDLGARLAQLHALDVRTPGDVPVDAGAATRAEVRRWSERYRAERLAPVPLLGALLAWLAANAPAEPGPAVLLWGDPGPHNVLSAGGRITAMLDWELAHRGSPLDDLGAAVWAAAGPVDPDLVVAGYEERSGSAVDRRALDYYTVLAHVSRSVMLLAGSAAFVAGRTASPVLAGLGLDLLTTNLARAAALAGWDDGSRPGSVPPVPPAPERLRPDAPETAAGVARYLADEVLPAVTDPRLVRGLKTAVALLGTTAARAADETAVEAAIAVERDRLLAELGRGPDLEAVAVAVETVPALAALRPRVRAHLVRELHLRRGLLDPLARLYRPGGS